MNTVLHCALVSILGTGIGRTQ